MKTLNLKYIDQQDLTYFVLKNHIVKSKNILLQIFTGINNFKYIEDILTHIIQLIPHIKIIGSTTSGEILESDSFDNSTILSFSIFNNTEIEVYDVDACETSSETAEKLISQFPTDRSPKVAISFIDGLTLNGEEYIKPFNEYDQNLIISGGLAGDNSQFKKTFVFTHERVVKSGAVIALLFSDFLDVTTQASFGWENIGKVMKITKSNLNVVYEIDGVRAIDVYAKYLGEDIAKELPKVGIEFPLIIQKDELSIPRAVLGTGENGSLVFAGNLYEGDRVTFGYGDIDSILNYSNNLNVKSSESIFIYSCMARKALMKDNIRIELIPLSNLTNISGFFTYGEFFSNKKDLTNELLNETMTILSLSETSCKNKICEYNECSENNSNRQDQLDKKKSNKNNSMTLRALSHLISQTSLELEEINSSLEKRIKKEVQENIKKEKLLQRQSRLAQMGEMISMIAHQWRQPLGAISSSVIGIESKISIGKFDFSKEEDREKFFKFLNRKLSGVNEYVQTLSETIDDFRNFFKPDKQKEKVSLSEPIKRALKIVENSLNTKGIGITTNFGNEDTLEIYQNEMMQVVLNILKNSEDNFMEKKISDPQITITTYHQNYNYVIQIDDNGGGISDPIIHKIFDPYFSTKNEKNGTGLGLYMSKIMIEDHHDGKLDVENISGGVSFTISICVGNS